MSTKIYNGYKMKGLSLDQVVQRLFDSKKEIEAMLYNQFKLEILNEAIENYYDMVFDILINKNLLNNGIDKNEEQQQNSALGVVINKALKDENNPIFKSRNFNTISICLYPKKIDDKNSKESYYLVQLFADNYKKLIESSKFWKNLDIKEYGYWNNSDQPEELTEIEWERRKKDWNDALGENFTPSKKSLVMELINEYKYNCIYFLNAEELTTSFNDIFNDVFLKNIVKLKKVIFNNVVEKINDTIAYNNVLNNHKISSEQFGHLEGSDRKILCKKMIEVSKNNDFSEHEKNIIEDVKNQFKTVLNQSVGFERLLLKKEDIETEINEILTKKKNKIK